MFAKSAQAAGASVFTANIIHPAMNATRKYDEQCRRNMTRSVSIDPKDGFEIPLTYFNGTPVALKDTTRKNSSL